MAQNIILKRSALSGKVPDTASLNIGEIAVNTYDGKLFIKRSGNTDSIQSIVTTDSITTGSIQLTQTGSFGEIVVSQDANLQRDIFVGRDVITIGDIDVGGDISGSGLQVNDTLNITHGLFSLSASAELTGSLGIDGDLTVLGAVNARQFNISIISSSVLFESGSSKFGNTSDDIHSFTGSVQITGSLTATSFVGDGSGLTALSVDLGSAQLNDVDGNSIPPRSFAELFIACAVADIVDLDFEL
jgi:ethanolamine utilization microcompartment shell protein EutS